MLDFQAGRAALNRIRDGGLDPADITVIAGAAGGPKWLVLSRLDRMLFTRWLPNRTSPLHLMGSSSGAWRFAAVAQSDPSSAIHRFASAYIHQQYDQKPTPAEVSRQGWHILQTLTGETGREEILHHPFLRLHVMTVRCRHAITAHEAVYLQGAGMVAAIAANALCRKFLGFFFDRVVFHDPRVVPPLSSADGLPTRRVSLTRSNLRPALLASGSIPLLMAGVRRIPQAPQGTYRDGGVIDYHMDLPYTLKGGLVLFPHYTHRIIPGWLDKHLPWRQPSYLDHTLLISPSDRFLDLLPYGKIPDRDDFWRFSGQDRQRIAYWQKVAEMGERLAETFWETVMSGRIRQVVRPYGRGR